MFLPTWQTEYTKNSNNAKSIFKIKYWTIKKENVVCTK